MLIPGAILLHRNTPEWRRDPASLKKVFRKLGIVSRRQLRDKVSSEPN